jgi:tyrosyl-tRNA synthetase|tara:strand:+ start:1820 stop:2194 length:375 start_codon:yes stop_codon:yes gene_type:complete
MGESDILKKQVKELTEKLEFFESKFQQSQKNLIKEALTEFTQEKEKNPLKSEFDRKFNRNKKQIIKQKILETAKTTPKVADLKYYIVNQLKYCSKASFYRYIEEMKDTIEIKEGIIYITEQVTV